MLSLGCALVCLPSGLGRSSIHRHSPRTTAVRYPDCTMSTPDFYTRCASEPQYTESTLINGPPPLPRRKTWLAATSPAQKLPTGYVQNIPLRCDDGLSKPPDSPAEGLPSFKSQSDDTISPVLTPPNGSQAQSPLADAITMEARVNARYPHESVSLPSISSQSRLPIRCASLADAISQAGQINARTPHRDRSPKAQVLPGLSSSSFNARSHSVYRAGQPTRNTHDSPYRKLVSTASLLAAAKHGLLHGRNTSRCCSQIPCPAIKLPPVPLLGRNRSLTEPSSSPAYTGATPLTHQSCRSPCCNGLADIGQPPAFHQSSAICPLHLPSAAPVLGREDRSWRLQVLLQLSDAGPSPPPCVDTKVERADPEQECHSSSFGTAQGHARTSCEPNLPPVTLGVRGRIGTAASTIYDSKYPPLPRRRSGYTSSARVASTGDMTVPVSQYQSLSPRDSDPSGSTSSSGRGSSAQLYQRIKSEDLAG
ncbi:hypothetical protein C8Q80DRAFT_1124076 [Daedaleopsis nitida]|nr:hypothetical protein C8Q80DRAFT_1124076 [Daedaleopsis nitida]